MKCLLVILGVVLISKVQAFNGGTRMIERIGCHANDRICYVYVSGEPAGPKSTCVSDSFRWSAETTPNHNEIFSLLTVSFMAGKKVNFNLDDECFSPQASFPKIRYINVYK